MFVFSISFVTFLLTFLSSTKVDGTPLLRTTDSNMTDPEECIAISARTVFEDEVPKTLSAGALLFRCAEATNSSIVFKAGRINTQTLDTVCEDEPLFSVSEERERADLVLGNKPSMCMEGQCVFFDAVNQTIFLSALILEDEVEKLREDEIEIPFLVTDVFYEFDGLLPQFGKSLSEAFASNINDPLVIRAEVFLGSTEIDCSRI